MSQSSPRLDLPYIQAGQAQKHVTHNEAIEQLDLLVQMVVQNFTTGTPPGNPSEGQAWAVGESATGDWAGRSGEIASWRGGGWLYVLPQSGWHAWGQAEGEIRVYDGVTWVSLSTAPPVLDNLAGVGINASFDATNKLAVAADATLLNNAGAGHQLKINKATVGDTASLLYQSGFSGRAEMGLSGNDDFTIKTSADGAVWNTGLTLPGISGAVQIGTFLQLTPGATPASATAGDVYFDSTTAKLRCFDGAVWQDLF